MIAKAENSVNRLVSGSVCFKRYHFQYVDLIRVLIKNTSVKSFKYKAKVHEKYYQDTKEF